MTETQIAPKDGATLIAEERRRQVEAEGWTPMHDDEWDYGELAMAAMCYVAEDIRPKSHELCYRITNPQVTGRTEPALWPWHPRWWKPKDRIRNLVRAGALIAAEIDRLQWAGEVS